MIFTRIISRSIQAPVIITSYDVSGLTINTSYAFYVQASDAAGNSSNSSTSNFSTLAPPDTEAPSAPTDLAASAITQSSLTLNWTASTDNVAVTGYDVYQNGIKINAAIVTTTSYNVTGLVALTSYDFYVVAKDAAGNISAGSNIYECNYTGYTGANGSIRISLIQSYCNISYTQLECFN